MSTLGFTFNGSDPGTGLNPLSRSVGNKVAVRGRSLAERIAQQQNDNTLRWKAATISINFRSGSYDGSQRYGGASSVRNKSEFSSNIINRPCMWISGYQRANRKDFELKALSNDYSKVADQRNKVLKFLSNKNKFASIFSEACDAAVTEGMVLLEPYLKPTPYLRCSVNWKLHHACDFFLDVNFRKKDLSDCSYVATNQVMECAEAEFLFPDVDPNIIWSGLPNYNKGLFYFSPYKVSSNMQQSLCSVVRLWQRKPVRRHFASRQDTGEMISFGSDLSSEDKKVIQSYEGINLSEFTEWGWGLSIYINNVLVVDNIDNPLGFTECPLVPLFWFHNPAARSIPMRFLSLPASMQDAQYLSDQRINMTHDILQARAQAGWLLPNGSVDDIESFRKTQNVGIFSFDPANGQPIPIEPVNLPPTYLEAIDQLRRFAQESAPVNEVLMGGAENTETGSGVKTMLEQGAGLIGMRPIFDDWDTALNQIGYLTDQIVFWNMPSHEVQRILGQEPIDPKFYNYSEGTCSMEISRGMHTDTQQKEGFNQWIEFCQLTGTQLPPEAWLKIAPLYGKEEIFSILQQQQQQQQQAATEAHQYEIAKVRAEIANINAKSLDSVAMATEREGRAQSNIGLREERESEMEKNKAIYIKNVIDSVVKLVEAKQTLGVPPADIQGIIEATNTSDIEQPDSVLTESRQKDMQTLQSLQPPNSGATHEN